MQIQTTTNTIEAYTDGSSVLYGDCRRPGICCEQFGFIGGWATVMKIDDKLMELSDFSTDTTNNRMELTAVIKTLEYFKEPTSLTIYTDSIYVKNGITTWIKNWKINDFRTAARKPVLNKDLWIQLDKLNDFHNVEYKWVKGHNGDPMNERADHLAGMQTKEAKDFIDNLIRSKL